MRIILVAVGSTRPLKLRAVSDALESFYSSGLSFEAQGKQLQPARAGSSLDPGVRFEVVGTPVSSGVGHTPLSRAELMAGARGRAMAVASRAGEQGQARRYFVGLEGGLDVVHDNGRRLAFLESWAFVADSSGRESWGHAGGVVLPEALAVQVLDQGVELSAAIDAFAGEQGIRDAQGAWGVLTGNLITRHDVLRTAVINAFAPFFNPRLYSR
jgi:inosine/xanthosine triphosphatase